MTDSSQQTLGRIAARVPVPQPAYERILRRRDRKRRNQRIGAGLLALALVVIGLGTAWSMIRDAGSGNEDDLIVPALPPDDGPCFEGSPCFDTDIFRIRVDGSELTPLRVAPERDFAFSISPDGRIAFHRVSGDGPATSSADVFTMAFDGSDVRRLTDDSAIDGFPVYSPDGTKIAFASERLGKQELFVMDPDGTDQVRLVHIDDDLDETHPTWSPDGRKIAFIRSIVPPGTAGGLWVMGSDGSDPHLLLGAPLVAFPTWSPDGTRIAFQREVGDEPRLGVFDIATGQVVDLGPGWLPRWSPDSSRLAFSMPGGGIYVLGVADPTRRIVVHPTGEAPIWSPDGESIVFTDQSDAG